MKIYRETVIAGRSIIRTLRASTRIKSEKGQKRGERANPTPEAVKQVNLRNAIKRLTIILNHNFTSNDYHLTLTYSAAEPTKEEVKKHLDNFIRRLRRQFEKKEETLKYVVVTEYENHRIHHHIVCTGIEPEVINRLWTHGHVNFKMLDESGNYYKLAEYLIKETEKTFRKPESVNKKRYSSSRSIVFPEVKKEQVSRRELEKDPEALKGYYIDEDTVRRYEHAILGVECLEYIMVSLTEEPRLKKWRKGKKGRLERKYAEYKQQTLL